MSKRRGQWVGDRQIKVVNDIPVIADVVQLLAPASALESVRDIVFERAIIAFHVRRVTVATINDLSWVAWHGRVADGTTTPLEALNPRSAAKTTMAHSSIVQFGALEVPPFIRTFDSAGVLVSSLVDGSTRVSEVDFDVKRSIQRGNEGIFLTLAANSDGELDVTVQWRVYYTYS